MASKIKIKSSDANGLSEPVNGQGGNILDRGELAFTYTNKKLWVGNVGGTAAAAIQIGGEITASQADITTSSIKIPTGKAVYDYVAGQLSGAGSFVISDGTTSQTVSGGETLTVTAGTGINAVVSATDTLTIASKVASSTVVGAAKFNTASFSVDGNGDVTIKSAGVSNTQLANSSVTIGTTSVSLGSSATTISGATLDSSNTINKSPVITLGGDLTGSVTLTNLGSGTLTATIAADSVALGTDTTGNYVASITNGSYITGGNGGSEGAALTIAVDATNLNTASKVVARDASGNFSAGTITAALSGNATTASTLQTSRTISLGGDLSGSASFNGSADVTITATIAANSVALGTDTTGNYVATITGTTNQVSVSGSGAETAAVTLSLPQDIHTGASPTFAGATLDAITVGVSTANTITTSSGNLVLDSAGGTINVNDNLTISGNLTVQGTTTTVNSTAVSIEDPIFFLGGTPTGVDTYDRGIAYKIWDGDTFSNQEGFFGFSRADEAFVFKAPNLDGDQTDGTIVGTSLGNAKFAIVTGTNSLITPYLEVNQINTVGSLGSLVILPVTDFHSDVYISGAGGSATATQSTAANLYIEGNIESTNVGVSQINGFVIDGGTF